ncbi:MAG: DNA polymerase III subunit gamma/tau [Spirochaetes bacterium]|nr:DNA polymerase III subunit gamma/tau [Spirochaetota bacterium]
MSLPTARKWRPQTFDEVIGQDETVKALKSAISTGRVGQAYLLSGPRGVGKTTLSRIIAKSLNCTNGPTPTPCGVCENCVEIREGTSVDVIEIDGASNRKIDDVRNIRESVKFVPVKSKYKIYIIDEVHMLTDEAFNALLKTLEEPPQHVVFIFATTEPYKVKQTIRSRCQHYVLKPLSVDNIFKQLKKISEYEGYKLTDNILMRIAKVGNGSMRDAESVLDTVISYLGEDVYNENTISKVDEEELSKIIGIIDFSHIDEIVGLIESNKLPELLKKVNILFSKGFDIKKLVEELITFFRNLLLVKEFGIDRSILKLLEDEEKILDKYKDSFSKDEIIFIQNTFIRAYQEMRTSINELFFLENALFRATNPDNVITISKILEEVKEIKRYLSSGEVMVNEHKPKGNQSNIEVIDPAEELLRDIEKSETPPDETVRKIIASCVKFSGVDKKTLIKITDKEVRIQAPYPIKDFIVKEIDEIRKRINLSLGIENVVVEETELRKQTITNQPYQTSPKPSNKTGDKIISLFDAKRVESFKER